METPGRIIEKREACNTYFTNPSVPAKWNYISHADRHSQSEQNFMSDESPPSVEDPSRTGTNSPGGI
jgi:hypothetical protein